MKNKKINICALGNYCVPKSCLEGKACFLVHCALVLLMLLPMAIGCGELKAQVPPEGLVMSKNWTPTSESGDEGFVTLEAFVTGTSLTVETHAPSDIALVLDVSGSMADGVQSVAYADLSTEKGAIEGYYVHRGSYYSSDYYLMRYRNNRWEEYASGRWQRLSNQYYLYISRMGALKDAVGAFVDIIATDAELYEVDHRISVVKFAMNSYYGGESSVVEGNHRDNQGYNYTEVLLNRRQARNEADYIKSQVNSLSASGATAADFGLSKVSYLFRQIPSNETDRSKVVVMFTDGSPTYASDFDTQVANSAILTSKGYKDSGVRVFTVGTFVGSPGNNVNTYMNYVSSNYPQATSLTFGGTHVSDDFYFTANTADQLSGVFESIAHSSSSVPVQMNAQTIVQDQIGTNFALPQGTAASDIKVYIPKCTHVNTAVTPFDYQFEDLMDGDISHGGNQLFSSVTIIGDLIRVTGFDFSEMWCGVEMPAGTAHGRKLVIKVPLKVEEGVWGDGLPTNGPLTLIFPNGDLLHPIGAFPIPEANVLGDVWTEIVVQQPEGFDAMNIDSPEDLAWFISVVNGRHNYDQNSNVPSNASLNGRLAADIDMSAHNWIPIGSSGVAYTGTFDGNGYVITGLKNNASKFYKHNQEVLVYPGMFGRVGNGGVVKNVFVLNCDMNIRVTEQSDLLSDCYGVIADIVEPGATIFNCEAEGSLSMTENSIQLSLGGLVGSNAGTIHSCMAMVRLRGNKLGGLAVQNTGSLRNSFTNPLFVFQQLSSPSSNSLGGLACENAVGATIDNCYVRLGRPHVLDGQNYSQLVWDNKGSISYCFCPAGNTMPVCAQNTGSWSAGEYTIATAPYLYGYDASSQNEMLAELNAHRGDGAEWKRTTAGRYSDGAGCINDDYPVFKYSGYSCLASSNGVAIDYGRNLSDMLKRHNEGKLNENTLLPQEAISGYVHIPDGPTISGHDYHVNAHPILMGGTINLYQDTDNRNSEVQNTESNVVVYIDENISLLQGANSHIEAYTCQTLTNPNEYWHTVSSSLTTSEIGFIYGTEQQIPFNEESNPCNVTFGLDDDHNLFPHDAPVDKTDLYSFYEPQYHWINLKRNSNSHWHMDNPELNIEYENEMFLIPGKGYLAAIDKSILLQNRGILNNGDVSVDVSNTLANSWTGLRGYNLLGNPYHSYLDFDLFANANGDLWTSGAKYRNTYSVYDPAIDAYVQYLANSSRGSASASRYINMHQGFFVVMDGDATKATFANDMRTNTAGSGFRSDAPQYPLINLFVTDPIGVSDVSVVEFGRSEHTGAQKMLVGNGKGHIWLRYDNADYAILFRNEIKGSQPLYFEALENGVYTLSWNMANAEFSKLTLVDNITGVSVDMLAVDSYLFTATTDDYKSRFKIVIGDDAGVSESSIETPFAFVNNGQLVVNGAGRLDVSDVLGRILYTIELFGFQNRIGLPANLNGICILHLSDGKSDRIQKIVF